MSDVNEKTIGDRLADLATGIRNLDSEAILTAFWYVVLVAVGAYTLYRAAAFLRNSIPSLGTRLRRACGYLLGRKR